MNNQPSFQSEARDQYIDLHKWQLAHIQKGVEARLPGGFRL